MSGTRKIKVNLNPVADHYASVGERIVEFSSPQGGGLISFRLTEDDGLMVSIYQTDDTVTVLGRGVSA